MRTLVGTRILTAMLIVAVAFCLFSAVATVWAGDDAGDMRPIGPTVTATPVHGNK